MKHPLFNHWSETKYIKDIVTNPLIEVGEYSYYSGYYDHGNYVCIASGVVILMGGNHNHHSEWITVYPFVEKIEHSYEPKGDTIIKSDAWIGMNAIIMPGVTIGEGAIVAAGSVVSKNVPPYTIVGGNPAKEIKKRFTDAEINMLMEMRWFDWDRELVEKAMSILSSSSIKLLYDFYNKEVKPR